MDRLYRVHRKLRIRLSSNWRLPAKRPSPEWSSRSGFVPESRSLGLPKPQPRHARTIFAAQLVKGRNPCPPLAHHTNLPVQGSSQLLRIAIQETEGSHRGSRTNATSYNRIQPLDCLRTFWLPSRWQIIDHRFQQVLRTDAHSDSHSECREGKSRRPDQAVKFFHSRGFPVKNYALTHR